MKKIILTLAVLLPTLSFASSIVKTFDGGVARCKEGADIGNRAYRLNLVNEKNTSTHKNLELAVSFFVCSKSSQGYGLLPIKLNAVIARPYLNESKDLDYINIELSKTRLFVYTEQAEVLGDVELRVNADGQVLAKLSLPLSLNTNKVIMSLKSIQTIKSKDGQVINREPITASTFLLNLN